MARAETYYDILTAAVNDIAAHGYDSAERVAYWSRRLKEAAEAQLVPESEMQRMLREALGSTYRRLIDKGSIYQYHPGLSRFTVEQLRPQIRSELDRRIMAAAELIKLNRTEAIEKTLRRFQGWSTSVPKGGSDAVDKKKTKADIRKSLAQQPFVDRRLLTDQSHKLVASISNVIATDGGALALRWHSHWRQKGYDYREDHKERDQEVYLLRDSWAKASGLIKPGPAGYYDTVTAVAEEPFCRCYAQYIYNLRDLPPAMLTAKGAQALAEARAKIHAA